MQAQVPGPVIQQGYRFAMRLEVVTTPGLFPSGVALTAHVKAKRTDAAPLVVLSTGTGELVRVSDTVLDVVIPASATADFPVTKDATVIMDFVRTDTDEPQPLAFSVQVPVILPVTPASALA